MQCRARTTQNRRERTWTPISISKSKTIHVFDASQYRSSSHGESRHDHSLAVAPTSLLVVAAAHETGPPDYRAVWYQYKASFLKVSKRVDEETLFGLFLKSSVESVRLALPVSK